MAPVDVMLQASIVAATILTALSISAQKYYSMYDVFVSKKYGVFAHGALVLCAWVQVLAISVYSIFSLWRMPSLWPVGVPMVVFAAYLYFLAVKEIGLGSIVNTTLFNGKSKMLGNTYKTYKHPMYIASCIAYVGVGFTTGRYGFFVASITLAVCLTLLAFLETPKKSK